MSLPNWTKQFKISVGLLAFLSLLLFGLYKYVAMRLAKSDSTAFCGRFAKQRQGENKLQ